MVLAAQWDRLVQRTSGLSTANSSAFSWVKRSGPSSVRHSSLMSRNMSPAAIGPDYFHEIFAMFHATAGGPPDKAGMMEIVRRHGLTPATPPPA